MHSAKEKSHGYDLVLLKNAHKPSMKVFQRIVLLVFRRLLKPLLIFLSVFMLMLFFYLLLRPSELLSIEESHPSAEQQNAFHPKAIKHIKDTPANEILSKKHVKKQKSIVFNNNANKVKQIGVKHPIIDHIRKPIAMKKQKLELKISRSNYKNVTVGQIARQRHKINELKLKKSSAQLKDENNSKISLEVKKSNKTKIYPNYYEDDLHTNWTFQISRNYDDRLLRHWTESVQTTNKSSLWTRGENGSAFVASKDEEDEMNKIKNENNFNIYASERISLHRTLEDVRPPQCRNLSYPDKLPTVSVIIVLHNEAWTTLLRTVWSIIDRSPRELLEEIILVDDDSTWPYLKRPLDDYIELLPAQVRAIHTSQREGLIRARLIGAKNATGSVLTFFDAHMEVTEGWLQPTLARIANDRSVVVVPVIDEVISKDMRFRGSKGSYITALRWHLIFRWLATPERELRRTQHDPTAPIRTPSHVGCAFSFDREFFFEIGSFDEQMEIWGSENVEMAFRVWMCGGSLEILPCSHVGHIYRLSSYSFNGDAGRIKRRNNVRLVEVWMDEFKDLFYAANPDSQNISPGDLTERKNLRKRLKCKSFRWYLENIYPESNWIKEYIMMGMIKSVSTKKCLDVFSTFVNKKVILYNCHTSGGNQFFVFAKSGQILNAEELCIGVQTNVVVSVHCSEKDKSQLWYYDSEKQSIVHRQSEQCMYNSNSEEVIMRECNSTDPRFQWEFTSTMPKDMLSNKEHAVK